MICILLFVAGATYLIFAGQRDQITQEVLSELVLMNNIEQNVLSQQIENFQRRTIDFSSDGFIRDMAKEIIATKNKKDIELLNLHLRKNKLPLEPNIYGINILDEKGTIIASTDDGEIGRDESKDAYYTRSELSYGTAFVSDFESMNHFKKNVVALAFVAPLTDKQTGERIGGLMSFVEADQVVSALNQQEKLLTGTEEALESMRTFVVSKDDFVVSGQYMDGASLTKKVAIGSILQCGRKVGYTNAEGVVSVGVASCMDNGWTVVTEKSQADALAPIMDTGTNIMYLMATLLLLILIIMYLLNRNIVDPIELLSRSAKKIGEGDMEVYTDIASHDELGDLSIAFNEMALRLRNSHRFLAARIREVTENFEKFKLAVEAASDHIIITDKDGFILYANRSAEMITGYTQQEMIGNRPSLWGKQMPTEFYRNMWRTIKEEKKIFTGEITNKRKNGQLYIAEIHIAPLFDEQGELYGFVGLERDITRQKEIDTAKTEFVSIASHQLRTPLTIINWYIEMLETTAGAPLSDKQKEYLSEIDRASHRMIELVNALLNVSRIDLGTFMVDIEPLDFALAMDDVLKDLGPQIAKKKLRIAKEYDAQLPQISADPKLLRMIFQNLLTNAVKYTPDEGTVTVGLKKQDRRVRITVADTGIGIPKEQQAKIFEKFFRADNARIKEPDGNGLGLYIIKSLIEHSGGTIAFTSKEDAGTTFVIEMPLIGMKKKEGTRPLAV